MNTIILNSFLTVVKYKSFTQASIELGVTQPTISNHVASLEELYHTTLFKRVGKAVELTAAGRAFVPVAERLLFVHADSIREMAIFRETTPVLRLGMMSQSALGAFQRILPKIREEFPGINIRVDCNYSLERLSKAIKEHDIDFGFINVNTKPLYMECIPILDARVFFIVSPKLYAEHNESNNIYEYPFLSYSDVQISAKVRDLDVDYTKLNTVLEANATSTLLQAIGHNVGMTLLTEDKINVYKEANDVVIFPAPYDTGKVRYSMVYDKELEFTPVKKRFLELINEIKEL